MESIILASPGPFAALSALVAELNSVSVDGIASLPSTVTTVTLVFHYLLEWAL